MASAPDLEFGEWRRCRWFLILIAVWLVVTASVLGIDVSDPGLLFLALAYTFAFLTLSLEGFAISLAIWVPVIAWLALPIWALVQAIRRARRRDSKRAVMFACAPVLAVVIILEGRFAAEFSRFELERGRYLTAIETVRAGGKVPGAEIDLGPPLFAYFNWGGMIWASKGVAYDESDEAGKPDAERSEAWRARRQNSEISCDAGTRHLSGHFYMVYAGC